jgi:hypothetical protein
MANASIDTPIANIEIVPMLAATLATMRCRDWARLRRTLPIAGKLENNARLRRF